MVKAYAIECFTNGMAYIGCSAAKLAKRMREHRCLLRNGKHTCKALQADWTKFGQEKFQIIELEAIQETDLRSKRNLELKWMRIYKDRSKLYNAELNSFRPCAEATRRGIENARSAIGNRWTPEANLKRSIAQLGIAKGHGAKISATKRAKRLARVDEIV